LAVLNAVTDPNKWNPDSSGNQFMEQMILAFTLSILATLAIGGIGALFGIMIMVIMLARFLTIEMMTR